jgi:hypothetical protein
MRLDKASFHNLVVAPVLKSVTLVEAREQLSAGADGWTSVTRTSKRGRRFPTALTSP